MNTNGKYVRGKGDCVLNHEIIVYYLLCVYIQSAYLWNIASRFRHDKLHNQICRKAEFTKECYLSLSLI